LKKKKEKNYFREIRVEKVRSKMDHKKMGRAKLVAPKRRAFSILNANPSSQGL